MATSYTLQRDPLAQALTRPAMFLGVPFYYVIGNALLFVYADALFGHHSLACLLLAVLGFGVVHAVGYLVCLQEPRQFRLLVLAWVRCPPLKTQREWGGLNSLSGGWR